MGKAPAGKPSPILSKTCGYGRNVRAVASGKTWLMEWSEHVKSWRNGEITRIYSTEPCDAAGYKFTVAVRGLFWLNRISRFSAHNWCNVATGYDNQNSTGDRQTWNGTRNPCACVTVGWVGHFMNDRIESFWIRRG